MKPKKFLEAASVRFQSSPSYPMLSDQSRTFFLTVLPWFNHPHLQDTPGLLLTPDGSPVTIPELSSTTNQTPDDTLACIKELARHGFLTAAECGAVACPIATEVLSRHQFFVEAGKRGGNPRLKQGAENEKKTTPMPTPLPNPSGKRSAKTQTRTEGTFLKLNTPPATANIPPTNPIYIKDTATGNMVNALDFAQIAKEMLANLGEFAFSIEGMMGGQPVSLKGSISPKNNPYANPQAKGYTNPETYPSNNTQTYEKQGVSAEGFNGGLTGGLGVGLTPGVDGGVWGRVNPHFERRLSRSHAYARHARGSHGSHREPILNTNNTLRVLEPYLIKYNCETNVSRSQSEPGGAGGIFEKTSNSSGEPNAARPTTLPAHETEPVTNLDSLSANRPEQFLSPSSVLDVGTFPTANRTDRTPAADLSFPVTDGFPTQTPLTAELPAVEPRPAGFAPLPRFEHSLSDDPALDLDAAGNKKPFVLKVLPIPNPFSSHPDVAKGDPELAASLLNGGFPPTKTPFLTTHDRKHKETTPPSCAPPPPPCPVFERHAPSPSDFVECPDVEDFDPAELYDENTPIEDFDPADRAGMSEPDSEEFAPIFDPLEIFNLETAPEAISDSRNTPDENLPAAYPENAPTVTTAPAIAILNPTSEKTSTGFETISNLNQIEKKNPGVEVVPGVVATEEPSVPVQVALPVTDEVEPAENPSQSKKTGKQEKPKRAKKPKAAKIENPDDPAQAEYLANYHRLLTFYGDKIKAKIPNYAAQGAAVKWLLQQGGYTPDECEQCLVDQFENWTKGSPSWLTVKAHIAAWKLRKENPVQPKPVKQYTGHGGYSTKPVHQPTPHQAETRRTGNTGYKIAPFKYLESQQVASPGTFGVEACNDTPALDWCLNAIRKVHMFHQTIPAGGDVPPPTFTRKRMQDIWNACHLPEDLRSVKIDLCESKFTETYRQMTKHLGVSTEPVSTPTSTQQGVVNVQQ